MKDDLLGTIICELLGYNTSNDTGFKFNHMIYTINETLPGMLHSFTDLGPSLNI